MSVHPVSRLLAAVFVSTLSGLARLDARERIEFDDRLAYSRYQYLVARSPTMRQMVRVIEAAPDVHVRVRAVPGLRQSTPHAAHGMVRVAPGGIDATLEFDSLALKLFEQFEMLAHELAHVVEVACLPRVSTANELYDTLLERGFGVRQMRSRRVGIETRFAIDVGRRVVVETLRRPTDAGGLALIARRHELGAPCTEPENGAPRATATH